MYFEIYETTHIVAAFILAIFYTAIIYIIGKNKTATEQYKSINFYFFMLFVFSIFIQLFLNKNYTEYQIIWRTNELIYAGILFFIYSILIDILYYRPTNPIQKEKNIFKKYSLITPFIIAFLCMIGNFAYIFDNEKTNKTYFEYSVKRFSEHSIRKLNQEIFELESFIKEIDELFHDKAISRDTEISNNDYLLVIKLKGKFPNITFLTSNKITLHDIDMLQVANKRDLEDLKSELKELELKDYRTFSQEKLDHMYYTAKERK